MYASKHRSKSQFTYISQKYHSPYIEANTRAVNKDIVYFVHRSQTVCSYLELGALERRPQTYAPSAQQTSTSPFLSDRQSTTKQESTQPIDRLNLILRVPKHFHFGKVIPKHIMDEILPNPQSSSLLFRCSSTTSLSLIIFPHHSPKVHRNSSYPALHPTPLVPKPTPIANCPTF